MYKNVITDWPESAKHVGQIINKIKNQEIRRFEVQL